MKVQYPDALPLFTKDLGNLRRLAALVSRTELAFDLVSAIDELSAQVKFEFNFERCAALRFACEFALVPLAAGRRP